VIASFVVTFEAHSHHDAELRGNSVLFEFEAFIANGWLEENLRAQASGTQFADAVLDRELSQLMMANATMIVRDPEHPHHPGFTGDAGRGGDDASFFKGTLFPYAAYGSPLLLVLLCWCGVHLKRSAARRRSSGRQRHPRPASPRDIDLALADAIDTFSRLQASQGEFDPTKPPTKEPREPRETFWVRARTRRLRWDDDGRGHVCWTGSERFVRRRRPKDERRKKGSSSSMSDKTKRKTPRHNRDDEKTAEDDDSSDSRSIGTDRSSFDSDDSSATASSSASWATTHRLEFVSATSGIGELSPPSEELRRALESAPDMDFPARLEAFRAAMDALRVHWTVGREEFTIRREHAFNDAFDAICDLPAEHWRRPFFVSFEDECALDAGGLSREFFSLVSVDAFDESFGCFRNCHGSYMIQHDDEANAVFGDARPWLAFAGRLMGKALLEGHHFAAHPCMILLKHVCGEPIELDDLQYVDFELWKNLMALLTMPCDVLASLDLTFALERRCGDDGIVVEELVPNGAATPVTQKNVNDYLKLRLKERVLDVCQRGLDAFLDGLYSVVPFEAFLLLSARELELTLCGIPTVPVDDWRASTVYAGAFADLGDDHPVVDFFWDVVAAFSNEQRAKLLQWCTGSSKVPVQGFDYLQGRDGVTRCFTLTSVELSQAVYPRAHTYVFSRWSLS